jgi:hypothetical protein
LRLAPIFEDGSILTVRLARRTVLTAARMMHVGR